MRYQVVNPIVIKYIIAHLLFALVFGFIPSLQAQEVQPDKFRFGIHQNYAQRFKENGGMFWVYGITNEIFQRAGFEVEMVVLPAKRQKVALGDNAIDAIISSEYAMDGTASSFIHSTLPLVALPYFIYYDNTSPWEPVWPPNELMLKKKGISVQSTALKNHFNLNLSRTSTFDASVNMVNLQRADYWLENGGGYKSLSKGLLRPETEGFVLRPLFSDGIYLYFQKTDRGRRLLKIFDEYHLGFFKDGSYAINYYRHDRDMKNTQSVDGTVDFINQKFPDLLIPQQRKPH